VPATGIMPTCIAYNALLVGYADVGDLESADAVLENMTAVDVSTFDLPLNSPTQLDAVMQRH